MQQTILWALVLCSVLYVLWYMMFYDPNWSEREDRPWLKSLDEPEEDEEYEGEE
jgi:hypothetical protein